MLRLRTETEASVELAETALWYERQRNVPKDLPARRAPVRRFPFHVVYLELSDEIRILAFAHDRRFPGYWHSRIRDRC